MKEAICIVCFYTVIAIDIGIMIGAWWACRDMEREEANEEENKKSKSINFLMGGEI